MASQLNVRERKREKSVSVLSCERKRFLAKTDSSTEATPEFFSETFLGLYGTFLGLLFRGSKWLTLRYLSLLYAYLIVDAAGCINGMSA